MPMVWPKAWNTLCPKMWEIKHVEATEWPQSSKYLFRSSTEIWLQEIFCLTTQGVVKSLILVYQETLETLAVKCMNRKLRSVLEGYYTSFLCFSKRHFLLGSFAYSLDGSRVTLLQCLHSQVRCMEFWHLDVGNCDPRFHSLPWHGC